MKLAPTREAGSLATLALLAMVTTASISAWQKAPDVGQAATDWPGNYVVQSLVRWDSGWYGSIATTGYWYKPGVTSPVAFFPLYPMVVRSWTWIGANVWLAGVLTSGVAGLVAVMLFARWARTLTSEDVARRSVWLLIVYPYAIYLYGIMYSDPLYLMLAVGAFLCLETDHVVAATLLGALATASRPVAPALVLGLLARRIEWRSARGEPIRLMDLLPLGAGLGFAAYLAYLGIAFHDPFAFVHTQGSPGWDQAPGLRTWLKLPFIEMFWHHHQSRAVTMRYVAHALVTAGLLALVPATYHRVGKSYALYLLLVVGLPALSSKDFMGMGRYGLAAFPAFLTLASLMRDAPWVRRVWLTVSLVFFFVLAAEFGATHYIS